MWLRFPLLEQWSVDHPVSCHVRIFFTLCFFFQRSLPEGGDCSKLGRKYNNILVEEVEAAMHFFFVGDVGFPTPRRLSKLVGGFHEHHTLSTLKVGRSPTLNFVTKKCNSNSVYYYYAFDSNTFVPHCTFPKLFLHIFPLAESPFPSCQLCFSFSSSDLLVTFLRMFARRKLSRNTILPKWALLFLSASDWQGFLNGLCFFQHFGLAGFLSTRKQRNFAL